MADNKHAKASGAQFQAEDGRAEDQDNGEAARDAGAGGGAEASAGGEASAAGGANGQAGAASGANGLAGDGAPAGGGDGGEGGEGGRPAAGDAAAELQALRERHLRLAAEFDNYRKRVERERGEAWVRAQAELAGRLLEPLDDLQRIADFDPATTASGALHEGAEMVERKFLRALEAAGLEPVDDAAGKPFDPTVHEALTTVPAASPDEDDTVAEVYQRGYRFKGVLLRPARVLVKKHQG